MASPEISDSYHTHRNQIYEAVEKGQDGVPVTGEGVAKLYDEWASKYEEEHSSVRYVGPANLAAIASDVISNKSSRILDAASGTGMVGKELKGHGFTCIDALEPSQESLDFSKRHEAYTEFIRDTLDEHQTNIADDCYDAVVMCGAFGVSGHVTDACFPELIRITKPGGHIIFSVGGNVLGQCEDKLEAAVQAVSQKGTWELVEVRWVQYFDHDTISIKAKVLILRVLKK